MRFSRTSVITLAALFLTGFILSGCGLADLALWLGKWKDGRGSVDFRMERFALTESFAGGQFLVRGKYQIDPNKYPKQVDFTVEEIRISFSQNHQDSQVLIPGGDEGTIRDVMQRVRLSAQSPEDDAAVRLLTVFAQSLPETQPVRGIYRIVMISGTYLQLELNRPDDGRPREFGQGYAVREY